MLNEPGSAADAGELLDSLRAALQGRYEVLGQLGTGGMGCVFRARDVALDRMVAIKVITPELSATRHARERLLREARTVAKLRHANIVTVYAAGEAEGLLYFVMEYVEGESLRQLLTREGRLDDAAGERGAALLTDLAQALAYAHEHGVVHRDVKPENVLLDRASGRAMLTDFGVARAFSPEADVDGDLSTTRTGFVVGSPRYMSPEQALGERSIDGRSDVYSLGLVGYEMFAGTAPFTGASPMAVLSKQLTERPMPLLEKNPDAPPVLARAIDRALEKEPDARWQSAAEFARAIEGEVPVDRSSGRVRRARMPRGRRRRWIAAAGAAMLLGAGGAIWSLRQRDAPVGVDPRKSYLVAPFEVLSGDAQLAWLREGSVSMLALDLGQWRDLSVVGYERSLDLLREAGLESTPRIGLADARAMARRAGVWTVVMGQVTSPGDSLVVTARLFDVASGKQLEQAQRSAPRRADPRPLFDALTRDLLNLAGAPSTMALDRLAEMTTSSVEAYRDYLEGTRALSRWQLARADSLFARATQADSTFALAYYKRAIGIGWRGGEDSLHGTTIAHAVAYSGKLPARERALVAAYRDLFEALNAQRTNDTARVNRSFTAAQRRYLAVIARDSGDAEAWYGLGDAYWHHQPDGWGSPATVKNWTRALRAFNRTLALDSTFYLAYAHKIDLYRQAAGRVPNMLLEGDSVRLLDSATLRRVGGPGGSLRQHQQRAYEEALRDARLWTRATPSPQAYQAVASVLLEHGFPDSAVAMLEEERATHGIRSAKLPFAIAMLQSYTDPHKAAATLHDALQRADAKALAREGGGDLMEILLGSGRGAALTGHLADVDALAKLTTEVTSSPAAVSTQALLPKWWALGVRVAAGVPAARWRPAIDSQAAVIDQLPPDLGYLRQQAAAGMYLVYLETRDPRDLATMRRWRGPRALPWPELEALAALDRREPAAAGRLAQSFPSADSMRAIRGGISPVRWYARARVLEELGELPRALVLYEQLQPRIFSAYGPADPAWPLSARATLAAARIHEKLGHRADSADWYRRASELLSQADPMFAPIRAVAMAGEARQRAPAGRSSGT
jgi:TolB-like protein